MNDADVIGRLAELGLELPPPPQALAAYVPVVVAAGCAFVAGQIATESGVPLHPGCVGVDVTVEQGAVAARRCALQALSALRDALGSFDRLQRIVKVEVFVASDATFTDQPKVANGASELLEQVLGEPGKHVRIAVGVGSLPLDACVEVAITAAVS